MTNKSCLKSTLFRKRVWLFSIVMLKLDPAAAGCCLIIFLFLLVITSWAAAITPLRPLYCPSEVLACMFLCWYSFPWLFLPSTLPSKLLLLSAWFKSFQLFRPSSFFPLHFPKLVQNYLYYFTNLWSTTKLWVYVLRVCEGVRKKVWNRECEDILCPWNNYFSVYKYNLVILPVCYVMLWCVCVCVVVLSVFYVVVYAWLHMMEHVITLRSMQL